MQFTKAEQYGILGILHLAEKGRKEIIPLSEVAEEQEVPEKFLAKIFQNLAKTGLVKSHRGVKGGFSLNKPPGSITIRNVVEAIQGPFHLIRCLHDKDCCDKWDFCPVRVFLEKAEDRLLEVFESYTLNDLLRWKKEHKKA